MSSPSFRWPGGSVYWRRPPISENQAVRPEEALIPRYSSSSRHPGGSVYPSETTRDGGRSENMSGRPEEATLGSGRRAIEIVMAASASTTTPEEDGHWHHVGAVESQSSLNCELHRCHHNLICRSRDGVPKRHTNLQRTDLSRRREKPSTQIRGP